VRLARACSSSESSSESVSISPARLARACDTPSSDDVREMSVSGRGAGTRRSGVLTAVRSLLNEDEDELVEPLGGVLVRSDDFFFVMLSARTPPSCELLRTELDGLRPMTPGI